MYIVTFTLPGFQTVKRENVELPSEFTVTINAEMKVGALEETMTVSAASPVVDVQSASHMQVLNREAIDAIPTGRTIQGIGQLIVGVSLSLPDIGGARAMQQTYMSTHGMTAANNTVLVDGMMVNGLQTRRRRPELLQRRDEPGGQLSDQRHRRRDVGGRRAAEHDSARRRQPVQRRLQRGVSARHVAGRTT